MYASTTSHVFTFFCLLGFCSAVPTPAELVPRCGTTLVPTILQQVSEAQPHLVGKNTVSTGGGFHVSQSTNAQGKIVNRIYQIVAFENIPSGSYGCQLAVTFAANYPIYSSGVPTLSITTLFNGESSSIKYPNKISWSSLYPPTSPPFGQGMFGTVTLTAGTTEVINSEGCPMGGGNLAFLFSIAVWETQAASVKFNEYVNELNGAGLEGVYLTYDC